jgi:hypothetical protein
VSRFAVVRLFVCAVPLFLLGCAQQSQVAATGGDPIRISYSVGPCYGTCPVYQVAIEANGATFFNGERHTRVEGTQQISNNAATFQATLSRLAPWKPEMGTTQATTDCEPRATDQQNYTVIWTNAAFEQAVLEHDTGCHSEAVRQLTETLRSLDSLVGVAPWVRSPAQ